MFLYRFSCLSDIYSASYIDFEIHKKWWQTHCNFIFEWIEKHALAYRQTDKWQQYLLKTLNISIKTIFFSRFICCWCCLYWCVIQYYLLCAMHLFIPKCVWFDVHIGIFSIDSLNLWCSVFLLFWDVYGIGSVGSYSLNTNIYKKSKRQTK